MLSQISIVLLTLLSHLDPSAADLIGLADRIGVSEVFDHGVRDPVATVQVDLLPDRDAAEALAATLTQRFADGDSELEVLVEHLGAEDELPPSYRVGVGPFDTFEDAERARGELEGLGVDGFVRELEHVLGC